MAGYRPAYTVAEEMVILDMIIKTNSYYKLRGRAFWEDLANAGLLDRSWMSLKERFEKHLLPKICDTRYEISDIEKKKLSVAYYQLGLKESKGSGDDDDNDNEDNDYDGEEESCSEEENVTHADNDRNGDDRSDK